MITGHRFRVYGQQRGSTKTGGRGAVPEGMCAWNGTCCRPEEEHELKRTPARIRQKTPPSQVAAGQREEQG